MTNGLIPPASRCRGCGLRAASARGTDVVLSALLSVFLTVPAHPAAAAADSVTQWSLLADAYGDGLANWRVLAIMHQAMHDAANAAAPTYARWFGPERDEPPATGGLPHAAMAAAAGRVLLLLHPERQADTKRAMARARALDAAGAARDAGVLVGDAIGAAAVARRAPDGHDDIRPFEETNRPGGWQRTPQRFGGSNISRTSPFLFSSRDSFTDTPPPAIDSDVYRRELDEVRRLGAAGSKERTESQFEAAIYWASQSAQRGHLHLAIRLLDEHPRPDGLIEHARIMSQVTTALADSVILTWAAKEHFAYWRPVTAIRAGSPGVEADPEWLPMLETPPFPEYPSGHAADCYTGSTLLNATFVAGTRAATPITYVSQGGQVAPLDSLADGMGQHAQPAGVNGEIERQFASLEAAADDCANSRIWAGAHFRAGVDEARRIGRLIAARAAAAVPPIR